MANGGAGSRKATMKTNPGLPEIVFRQPREIQHCNRREPIPLSDLSDCLLAAYDGVSRLAFRRYVSRGSQPGNDLEDWKEAQRDLFCEIRVDFSETKSDLYALAGIAGYEGKEITVAVDEQWLLIWGHSQLDLPTNPAMARGGMELVAQEHPGHGETLHANIRKVEHESISATTLVPLADNFEGCVVPRPFCVLELRARVDPARSVAVLANGLLAIRMRKAEAAMAAACGS
jgi:HSP20 family molecular chaperone IbpA